MPSSVTVSPQALRLMASDADRTRVRCRAAAAALDIVDLPATAFGGVKHSLLISTICDNFGTSIKQRTRSSATDSGLLAEKLRMTANDFVAADLAAAEQLRKASLNPVLNGSSMGPSPFRVYIDQ
jgi:hypothetical protein